MNIQTTSSLESHQNAAFRLWRGLILPALVPAYLLIAGSFSSPPSALAEDGELQAGEEFLVDEDTLLGRSDVAVNKHGEFLIAYDQLTLFAGGRVGAGNLFGQRYDREGQALSEPFKINDLTLGNPATPAVALHHNGHSVVTWSGALPGAGLAEIWARRYDAAGNPVTVEFQVNTFVLGLHSQPDVAMDDLGNFVITWTQTPIRRGIQNVPQDGSGQGVFAQRYDWSGNPLGDEFPVHTMTIGDQSGSRVAVDHLGDFVMAWTSPDGVNSSGGTSFGVFARRFDRFGVPQGAEFLVNEHTANRQFVRGMASDAAGRFAVLWAGDGPETDGGGVYVRLFDETGAPRTGQLRVNPVTTQPFEFLPGAAISVEKKGNYVVTWDNSWSSSAPSGIFGQVFDAVGGALTDVFEASAPDGFRLTNGSVGLNKHGQLLVSWLNSDPATPAVWAVLGRFFEVDLPGNGEHDQ